MNISNGRKWRKAALSTIGILIVCSFVIASLITLDLPKPLILTWFIASPILAIMAGVVSFHDSKI